MNRQIPMNRQIRLALSTTTLLIGVALLASCSPSLQTESPPPQEQSSQALREEMEEERKRVLAEQKRLESAYVVSREAQAASEPLRRQALEGAPEFFEAEIWIIAKTSPAEDFTEYADPVSSVDEGTPDPGSGSLVANVPSRR